MKKGSILFQLIVLCGVIGLLFFYTPEGGWYAKVLERYDLSTIVITKVCVGILILNFFGFFKMIYDYIIIKNGKNTQEKLEIIKLVFFFFALVIVL
ncbi:MAG: hypothetical protein QF441_02820 [Bacteriovoracaceae bacterium]|jgi:hypothetical protein|nr:hypothetical protein [Bacteriovoracaceae bacterium]